MKLFGDLGFKARNSSSKKAVLCAIIIAIISAWLFMKVRLFYSFEYSRDLLVHLQKTKSFLDGLPFFYDHFYGDKAFHASFIQLFFAPFTRLFGAFGLMIPGALVFGFCAALFVTRLSLRTTRDVAIAAIFIGVMLFGPVGFWLFDNPEHGWHSELLAFPFSLLYACVLVRFGHWPGSIGAIPLVLTHEAGILSAWGVAIAYEGILCSQRFSRPVAVKRVAAISIFWLLSFILSVSCLCFFDSAGGGAKIASAFSRFSEHWNVVVVDCALMYLGLFLFLFSSTLFLFLLIDDVGAATISLVAAIPVILALTMAGLHYSGNLLSEFHNILWAPRFSFIWGVVVAGVFFAVLKQENNPGRVRMIWFLKALTSAVAMLVLQWHLLREIRSYDMVWRMFKAIAPIDTDPAVTVREREVIDCLADRLPREMPVYSSMFIWSAFHQFTISPFINGNPYRVYPQVRVCLDPVFVFPDEPSCGDISNGDPLDSSLVATSVERLTVYYLPDCRSIVSQCLEIGGK
jgi:hypothetical protein